MIRQVGFIPPVKIVCTFVNTQRSLFYHTKIIIYPNVVSGILFLNSGLKTPERDKTRVLPFKELIKKDHQHLLSDRSVFSSKIPEAFLLKK